MYLTTEFPALGRIQEPVSVQESNLTLGYSADQSIVLRRRAYQEPWVGLHRRK